MKSVHSNLLVKLISSDISCPDRFQRLKTYADHQKWKPTVALKRERIVTISKISEFV